MIVMRIRKNTGKGAFDMNRPAYGMIHDSPAIAGNVPEKYPWLSEDRHCDVCIVGGGMTGAMCALAASGMDRSVVLLTAGAVGYGVTGSLTGGAEYDGGSTLIALDRIIGTDEALRYYAMGMEALDDIGNLCAVLDGAYGGKGLKTGFRRCDSLLMTDDASDLELMEREYLARRAKFPGCTFLDAATAASSFDFACRGGILTREGGAVFDPYAFTHLCLRKAAAQGTEIYEQTEAVDIQTPRNESGSVIIKTSTRRTVYADRLILATGCDGIDAMTARTRRCRAFTAVAPPDAALTGWAGKCLVRTMHTFGRQPVSCVIRPDGSTAASAVCRHSGREWMGKIRETGDDAVFRRLGVCIEKLHSADAAIGVKYEYTEELTAPSDGLPIIGQDGRYQNCILALTSPSVYFGDTGAPVFARIAAATAIKHLHSL